MHPMLVIAASQPLSASCGCNSVAHVLCVTWPSIVRHLPLYLNISMLGGRVGKNSL